MDCILERMNPEEYYKLADVEKKHWFYVGKRAIVKHWIGHYRPLQPTDIFIDVGCGTGVLVEEMQKECLSFGIESSPDALRIITGTQRKVIVADASFHLPLKDKQATVVTALDVLEHIEDDKTALKELIRIVKAGGLIIVTVPAFGFLMSDWDESLGHYRRYVLNDFKNLLNGLPIKVLHQNYINSIFFIPIMLYRLSRKYLKLQKAPRLEDVMPPPMAQ